MQVSCTDSDVHSCFELRSVLSQSSWIRHYKSVVVVIIIIFYFFCLTSTFDFWLT